MSKQSVLSRVVVSDGPPVAPRLVLTPVRTAAAGDGVWWPRSFDALSELPGLIASVRARLGPVNSVMLSRTAWTGDFRRLIVAELPVRVGWFATLDPSLAIVTTDGGGQLDLMVIPPTTPPTEAERAMHAMEEAALERAESISSAADPIRVWDDEGGHPA